MTTHHVTVETTAADPFYPGHPGYYAECDVCGHLSDPAHNPRWARLAMHVHAAFMDAKDRPPYSRW